MKTTALRYSVLIKKEGKHYIASVPTLGISDFGETKERALENVTGAIACHIEGLAKTHTEIPAPDTENVTLKFAKLTVPFGIRFAL
jgi:predicted RNase H-like HicB family nuclease